MLVGGIQVPKHFGQSGQPIPDPVLLTTPPTKIKKYTEAIVITPIFLNLLELKDSLLILLVIQAPFRLADLKTWFANMVLFAGCNLLQLPVSNNHKAICALSGWHLASYHGLEARG